MEGKNDNSKEGAKRFVMVLSNHVTQRRCIPLCVLMTTLFVCVSVYTNPFDTSSYPTQKRPPLMRTKSNNPVHSETNQVPDVRRNRTFSDGQIWKNDSLVKEQRLPNCIIIGVKKGGTSTIVNYLNLHPDIAAKGEHHFFSLDSNYNRGFEYYRSRMPYTFPHQLTIEKTPRYWSSEIAMERIYKFDPNIKLIVTLRHPITRLISDYYHDMRHSATHAQTRYKETFKFATLPLEELVIDKETGEPNLDYLALNTSMYYMHMKQWLELFPKKQIHVVDGDNLIVNPFEEVEKMETFLGVEHKVTKDMFFYNPEKGFNCVLKSGRPKCMPGSKGHSYPDIDPALHRKLKDFFDPLNEQFYQLMGRRFDWN